MKRSFPFQHVDSANVSFLEILPLEIWQQIAPYVRPYKTWYSFVRSCKGLWQQCGGYENVKKCFPGTNSEELISLSEFAFFEKDLIPFLRRSFPFEQSALFKELFAEGRSYPIIAGGFIRLLVARFCHLNDIASPQLHILTVAKGDLDCWFSVPDFFTPLLDDAGRAHGYQWPSQKVAFGYHQFSNSEYASPTTNFHAWKREVKGMTEYYWGSPKSPVFSTQSGGSFYSQLDCILVDRSFEHEGSPILGFDISASQFALSQDWYEADKMDVITTPLAMYSIQTGRLEFVSNGQYSEREVVNMILNFQQWLDMDRDVDEDSPDGEQFRIDVRYLLRLAKYFFTYGYEHETIRPLLDELVERLNRVPKRIELLQARYAEQVSSVRWRDIKPAPPDDMQAPPVSPQEEESEVRIESNSISDEDGMY